MSQTQLSTIRRQLNRRQFVDSLNSPVPSGTIGASYLTPVRGAFIFLNIVLITLMKN